MKSRWATYLCELHAEDHLLPGSDEHLDRRGKQHVVVRVRERVLQEDRSISIFFFCEQPHEKAKGGLTL